MRRTGTVSLTEEVRSQLLAWAHGRRCPVRLAQRAQIVLLAAEGKYDVEIGDELGVSRHTARLWRKRFLTLGADGIRKDAPRPGRRRELSKSKERAIVEATLHSTPSNATHWSVRLMAQSQNISRMAVQRIWRRHNLKPHLLETFKLSKDPHFVEKLEDIVGLYLNPPDKALVLCVDEKSQIQALDRTRPMLPLARGVPAKQTHDYKRNGTTTLFAALSMLDGAVVGECMARHRHQEFIRFLKRIDQETPAALDLHLIVDNYATHKHPKVKAWLKRHPRFHLHFTPTSSSWLNMVERWFRNLTDRRIRRGTFNNVAALIEAITDYISKHNLEPKAFVWSAPVKQILDKVNKLGKCIDPLGTLH